MTETKALSKKSTPQVAEQTALDRVDLAGPSLTARDEVFIELGRLKESQIMAGFTGAMFAQKLARCKREKLYTHLGYATWDDFISKSFAFSVDTADRKIKELEEMGPLFMEVRELVRVTRAAWAAANPEFDNGQLVIAGEKFKLTAANAPAIQQAFQEVQAEARRKADEASGLKADLDKARAERDNAKKAVAEATRKLREALSPDAFADADEDYRVMLRAQSAFDAPMLLLDKLRERTLLPENEARYIGLMEYLYRRLVQATDEARFMWGRGENDVDPADSLDLNNNPDNSRNLLDEYVSEKKGKGGKK